MGVEELSKAKAALLIALPENATCLTENPATFPYVAPILSMPISESMWQRWRTELESRIEVGAIKFNYAVPLEQTMAFEEIYHKALQLDLSGKGRYWDLEGSIFVWVYLDNNLAGESYGFPITSSNERIKGLSKLTNREKKTGIYCYSNTVLPSFQRQGLGTILKAHWLGLAVGKGFDFVYGHARPGASQALNAKFGAVFLDGFPDWGGTGEEYRMYRLELK